MTRWQKWVASGFGGIVVAMVLDRLTGWHALGIAGYCAAFGALVYGIALSMSEDE